MLNTRITHRQVAIVLKAVATVEGWDGAHNSIMTNEADESWITDAAGNPQPSAALLAAIRQILQEKN